MDLLVLSWAKDSNPKAVKSLEPGIESIMEVVDSWADKEEFDDRNHYFATKMKPRNPKIRNWKRCCQIFFHCLRWTKETTNLDQISGSFPLSISRNRKSLASNCLWLHAPYVPLWEYRPCTSIIQFRYSFSYFWGNNRKNMRKTGLLIIGGAWTSGDAARHRYWRHPAERHEVSWQLTDIGVAWLATFPRLSLSAVFESVFRQLYFCWNKDS